jgi:predicted small lipoprotein YifL
MKRLISTAMLLMFGAAIAGCEAHGRVGNPDDTSVDTTTSGTGHTYEKKTTTYDNGDRTVKTETHVSP